MVKPATQRARKPRPVAESAAPAPKRAYKRRAKPAATQASAAPQTARLDAVAARERIIYIDQHSLELAAERAKIVDLLKEAGFIVTLPFNEATPPDFKDWQKGDVVRANEQHTYFHAGQEYAVAQALDRNESDNRIRIIDKDGDPLLVDPAGFTWLRRPA